VPLVPPVPLIDNKSIPMFGTQPPISLIENDPAVNHNIRGSSMTPNSRPVRESGMGRHDTNLAPTNLTSTDYNVSDIENDGLVFALDDLRTP
jgi:hypothetical protein